MWKLIKFKLLCVTEKKLDMLIMFVSPVSILLIYLAILDHSVPATSAIWTFDLFEGLLRILFL